MKKPITESIGLTVQRGYGGQKARIQHSGDLSAALKGARSDAEAGAVLLAELRRVQGVLDAKEQALMKQDGGGQ